MRLHGLAAAFGALLLLSGCSLLGRGDGSASLEPRAALARKAVLAAANQVDRSPASGGKSAATVESDPGAGKSDAGRMARVEDARGDQGDGPPYADLATVSFVDSDEGLDMSITLDAVVPGRLARREMEEVGVALFRVSPLDMLLGRTASDYQVRLEGGAYGWRAFLRSRDGYVPFPGTFSVSGRTLRVVLPWEAVGGRRRAEAETFVDWSSGVGRLSTDGVTRVRLVPER